MLLKIGRGSRKRTKQPIVCATFEEASKAYSQLRDESGEGASTWPEGRVYRGTQQIGRISYNGRVWKPKPWGPTDEPIYDPYPKENVS